MLFSHAFQRKLMDLTLNRLSNLITILIFIDSKEYSYEKCCRMRRYARLLMKLSLRNRRMGR